MRPRITSFLKGLRAPSYFNRTTKLIVGTVMLCAAIVAAGYGYDATQAFSGGSGTPEDPYVITTCAELQSIDTSRETLNAHYILGNSIDCSSIGNFTPIGSNGGVNLTVYDNGFFIGGFTGWLDGRGYTISNVTLNYPTSSRVGLFAGTQNAVIKNLTISNAVVDGRNDVGSLIGIAEATTLVGVTVSSSTITVHEPGTSFVSYGNGGVVGYMRDGYIYESRILSSIVTSNGLLASSTALGGFVGRMGNSRMANSYSSATTTNTSEPTGGMVGAGDFGHYSNFGNNNEQIPLLINVYGNGYVEGPNSVGGIIGKLGGFLGTDVNVVKNAYFDGIATTTDGATGSVGGIAGTASASIIYNSFVTGRISKTNQSGAIAGGGTSFQNNVYYPAGTSQTDCDASGGYPTDQCAADTTLSHYNDSSFAPLSSWDFANIWQPGATRPALKLLPYSAPSSATSVGTCNALVSAIRANPDGWYGLSNDVDCSAEIPINIYNPESFFTGILDGNNHNITGVGIATSSWGDRMGLFTDLPGTTVRNLGLSGSLIDSQYYYYTGALAAYAPGSVLINVSSSVNVIGSYYYTGGLIGYDPHYLKGVRVTGSVTSRDNGNNFYLGGIIGSQEIGRVSIIDTAYSVGSTTGYASTGGIAGYINDGDITNSISGGTIASVDSSGGFVGYMASGTISNSTFNGTMTYNLPQSNYIQNVGGFVGLSDKVHYDSVTFSGTIDLTQGSGAEVIGGIVGEFAYNSFYSTQTTNYTTITNSTSAGSILLIPGPGYEGDNGDGFYKVGGFIGNQNRTGSLTNVISSTNIIIGSATSTTYDAEKIGGIQGASSYTNYTYDSIRNATSTGSITIYGGGSGPYMYAIGGIAGQSNSDIVNASFTGNITIDAGQSAGYVENIGGIVGSHNAAGDGPSTLSNSRSSANLTITTNEAYYIGGVAGTANTNVASSSYVGSISITSDPTAGDVESVGGVAGRWAQSSSLDLLGSHASTTITIAANYIDSIGGVFGQSNTLSSLTSSFATSTIRLSGSGSAYAYGVGGLGGTFYGYADLSDTYAITNIIAAIDTIDAFGGLVGDYEGQSLSHSYASGTISAVTGQNGTYQSYESGGIIGFLRYAIVEDVYSRVSITLTNSVANAIGAQWFGGLVGYAQRGASIARGYSSGALTFISSTGGFSDSVGGAIGYISDESSNIQDVFSAGLVSPGIGATNFGGFLGTYGTTTNTFSNNAYDLTRSGQPFCTGIDNPDPSWCTGRNVGNAAPTYFYSSANAPQSAWDFSTLWLAHAADFPTFGIGGPPPSSTPPSVTTDGSSSITQTSALLAGTLTAAGTAAVTEEGFVFGTSTTYSATSTSSSGSFSTGAYTKSLSSLTASTTYHYAAYAKSADGTSYGTDLTFTTSSSGGGGPATPPSVSSSGSASVTETSVTLSGNLASTGTGTVTEEGFVYGVSSTYSATTTSSGTFSAGAYTKSLSSLTASTTYHFAAYAKSADGIGYGNDLTFTTDATTGTSTPPSSGGSSGSSGGGGGHSRDVTAPVITNVHVDSRNDGTVIITWDTNEPASSRVEYGPTTALGYTTAETDTSARVTSHTVTIPAADCKNASHFSIFSSDADDNTATSPNHIFITTFCPSTAPPAVVPPPTPKPPAPPTSSGISSLLPTFLGGTGPGNNDAGSQGGAGDASQPNGDVTVNKGAPMASDRIVNLLLTVPDGAVAFVITNDTLGTPAVTVPVTIKTQQLDLCQGAETCRDREYALSFYYLMPDGSKSPVITRSVNLQAAANDETGIFDTSTTGLATLFGSAGTLAHLAEIAAITGIAATLLSVLWSSLLAARSLADLPLVLWRNITALFSLGFLRRRKASQWGTVYDSATRRGLDPALVTVFDATGKKLKTVITDLDGRYSFLLPAGVYSLKAEKSYHSFPAHNIPAIDPVFPHPYTGGPITLNEAAVLTADVPLDPTEFDWNEAEKYKTGLYRFYSRMDRPWAYLSMLLTIIGGVCAVISLFINPNPLNIVLFIIYAGILLYYLLSGTPRIYGAISDRKGMQVPFALVRAKLRGAQNWGAHTVTDQFGRYYLLLPPGKLFDVSVEALSAPNTYTPLWQGTMAADKGYLNEKITV